VSVYISGWGTAVPDGVLTNADLEARLDTSDAWIVERTGIRERRIAAPHETSASLGIIAARRALDRSGTAAADIDLLIVATTTPDHPMPHTGAPIGEALGLRCGSFDLNAACSGFVYAAVVAHAMALAGCRHVLVVGTDTMSRITDADDRGTAILFGDAAGAAVFSAHPAAPGLVAWDLGCDGSATDILIVPAGGSVAPATASTVAEGGHYIRMQGQEVFKRAVRAVVDSAALTLERAEIRADEIDWFVPHQANSRIIDAAAQRLGIASDRTISNIDAYGNTSAASIPLALFEAVDAGRVQDGDLLLLSGFGAGMTWASALLRWGAPT
jgi:3-oxoacyl-[acyl-carrier-protein] synthase-3